MSQFVIIRNEKGSEKRVSAKTWELLASKTSTGNTRKGWTLIGPAPGGPPTAQGRPMGPTASFLPLEIQEKEQREHLSAEVKAATEMIAAEPAKAPPAPPVQPVSAPAPVVEAPAPTPAPEAAEASTEPKDDLASLPNLGTAVATVLNGIGIRTYKQLKNASVAEINKALDASKFSAKKAQVPTWKMKASELGK